MGKIARNLNFPSVSVLISGNCGYSLIDSILYIIKNSVQFELEPLQYIRLVVTF